MKLIALHLITFCACLVLSKTNYDKAWKDYKKNFKKSYGSKEDARRKQIFIENTKMIAKHNKEAKAGKYLYYMGEGPFTDVSDEELENTSPCAFPETKSSPGGKKDFPHLCADNTVPDSIDWNKRGLVTPAQYQGGCGACYAFAGTGVLESHVAAKSGKLIKFSEQQVIDCGYKVGDKGCDGGAIGQVFKFVKLNNGTVTEDEYPYTSAKTKEAGQCKDLKPSVPIYVKRMYSTAKGTEEELKKAVGTVGPVGADIPAPKSVAHYKHGIFMDTDCASHKFDHGVIIVGYDTDADGTDYWIIKNSWGTSWGKNGFMHMKRNARICKIGESFQYPIL